MNDEQLAALTDDERRGPYVCECSHPLSAHGSTSEEGCNACGCHLMHGGYGVDELLTALADARLEVARLTEERQLMERSVVRASGEREKAENAVASSVVRSEIAESQWLEYRDAYDEVVKQSLQQREDIRRAIDVLTEHQKLAAIEGCGRNRHEIAQLAAEIRERYKEGNDEP